VAPVADDRLLKEAELLEVLNTSRSTFFRARKPLGAALAPDVENPNRWWASRMLELIRVLSLGEPEADDEAF
jgi:hypothetical protein